MRSLIFTVQLGVEVDWFIGFFLPRQSASSSSFARSLSDELWWRSIADNFCLAFTATDGFVYDYKPDIFVNKRRVRWDTATADEIAQELCYDMGT